MDSEEHREDLKCFNQFFADYQLPFIRFAESYVHNRVAAEDIVLESFMKYWENRFDLPKEANIQSYVLTIVKNKCLNYLEHERVSNNYVEHAQEHAAWELNLRISTLEACEPNDIFEEEIQNIINKTLKRFSEQTKYIFQMSRYEQKSHCEIADKLHITTKAVEYHITKVLKVLRNNLKDYIHFIVGII